MEIFLDTADVQAVEDRLSTGIISGITTNPTLIKKSGRDPGKVYADLISLGITDLSVEVVGGINEMITTGQMYYSQFGHPVTVKVPCSIEGLKACKTLSAKGIRVNVTLVFSPSQAILSSLAGATYISPFVGRMDDNSLQGLGLINDISNILKPHNSLTKVLAASIRDVQSVSKAFQLGADVCTIPPTVFDKMFNHVLTDKGIKQFEHDTNGVTVF
jgi:transaldolase